LNNIKGVKEVFLPPQPKDLSEELKSYLREIERNLREITSRTYTDVESIFVGADGLRYNLDELSIALEDLGAALDDLGDDISMLQTIVNSIAEKINLGGTNRPSNPSLYQAFFDSSLGKPIWWSGSNWVDSEGNIV